MFLGVGLPCLFRVVSGMNGMPTGCMSMMGRFLVLPALVMLGRFTVMSGGMCMMLRGLFVVIRCFLRHDMILRGLRP